METMGKNIRRRREQLGLTQKELAEMTGYTSKTSVTKIEQGKVDLTQSKIIAFSKALQCSVDDILEGTEIDILVDDSFIGIKVMLEKTFSKYQVPFHELPEDLRNQLIAAAVSACTQYYQHISKK